MRLQPHTLERMAALGSTRDLRVEDHLSFLSFFFSLFAQIVDYSFLLFLFSVVSRSFDFLFFPLSSLLLDQSLRSSGAVCDKKDSPDPASDVKKGEKGKGRGKGKGKERLIRN